MRYSENQKTVEYDIFKKCIVVSKELALLRIYLVYKLLSEMGLFTMLIAVPHMFIGLFKVIT